MIQRQGAGIEAVIVLDDRGQLLQNNIQVILGSLNRHRLCMAFHILHMVVFLDNIRKGVEVAIQDKGFLNQFLGIGAGVDGVGLDDLLAAVEVLHHGIRGHFHGKGAGGQGKGQRQRDERNKFLHTHFLLE